MHNSCDIKLIICHLRRRIYRTVPFLSGTWWPHAGSSAVVSVEEWSNGSFQVLLLLQVPVCRGGRLFRHQEQRDPAVSGAHHHRTAGESIHCNVYVWKPIKYYVWGDAAAEVCRMFLGVLHRVGGLQVCSVCRRFVEGLLEVCREPSSAARNVWAGNENKLTLRFHFPTLMSRCFSPNAARGRAKVVDGRLERSCWLSENQTH